ncbi:B12 binding domain-containing protein [Roseivivax lentus]|uniref:B12 binding domain-containing protein n=1 Tax=Roseivivax lentus TaxID=633194 RepID=A0A1N7JMJ1_9RHOB|nr:cobalamin-dependent protein [Roseivivax lentus]SIS50520.1 B12 binding domain-containing protein [Roseivivax lentus]
MSDFLSNPANVQEDRPEISALAHTVVSLMQDNTKRKVERHLQAMTDHLVLRVRAPGPFAADKLVSELLSDGLHADDLIDVCIPAAARVLGAMWCEDQLNFAEVTIGSARLQGLLSLLAPPWSVPSDGDSEPAIAIVLPDGETHTLGVHVITAQLRRKNASVRLLFGPTTATLLRILRNDPFDGVFFSCTRKSKLPAIAEMMTRIKSSFTRPPALILGGLALTSAEKEAKASRADLVTDNALAAFEFCRRRMKTDPPKVR